MAYPATFQTIQNNVINKLRLDSTNDLTMVKDQINTVYSQVCIETEATQTSATMALTANTGSYTLPTAVVRIKAMSITPVGNSSPNRALVPVSLEQILDWRTGNPSSTGTGTPSHYALVGYQQLEVWPTPTAADVITIWYVAEPTALSANGDVPVLQEPYASKILEYGALAEMADFLLGSTNPTLVAGYRQMFEIWMRRYRTQLRRKQGAGTLQFRVPDSWLPRPHDPSTDLRVA